MSDAPIAFQQGRTGRREVCSSTRLSSSIHRFKYTSTPRSYSPASSSPDQLILCTFFPQPLRSAPRPGTAPSPPGESARRGTLHSRWAASPLSCGARRTCGLLIRQREMLFPQKIDVSVEYLHRTLFFGYLLATTGERCLVFDG
jgi:hypothetical protein